MQKTLEGQSQEGVESDTRIPRDAVKEPGSSFCFSPRVKEARVTAVGSPRAPRFQECALRSTWGESTHIPQPLLAEPSSSDLHLLPELGLIFPGPSGGCPPIPQGVGQSLPEPCVLFQMTQV